MSEKIKRKKVLRISPREPHFLFTYGVNYVNNFRLESYQISFSVDIYHLNIEILDVSLQEYGDIIYV